MLAALLLSLGCRIVVHGPAELRRTFRQMARLALEAAGESALPEKRSTTRT
jgi:hypothetical protein